MSDSIVTSRQDVTTTAMTMTTATATTSRQQSTTSSSSNNNNHDDEVYRAMACYVRCFLGKAHPMVGREGPVCPFVPTALRYDTIRIAIIRHDMCSTRDEIAHLVTRMISIFQTMPPLTEQKTPYKAIILTFPDVTLDQASSLIDDVQRELKVMFVSQGLMLGEFHLQNQAHGLRNEHFYPLRTPYPSLAIRNMVPSDLVFLNPSNCSVSDRTSMLTSYINKFAADSQQEKFVTTAKETLSNIS